MLINGYSAPGASANTNPINLPNNAVITIQIDGPGPVFNPAAAQYGLRLGGGSDGSIIQGLSLTHWAAVLNSSPTSGAAIRIDSNKNFILGCFLGVAPNGTLATNFTALVNFGDSNTIGDGTSFGRNLLAGQYGGRGVLNDLGTNTLIQGNTIGLNTTGNAALMTDARLGVIFNGAVGSKIIGNIIAGHSAANIFVENSQNLLIQNNSIGTDITGSIAVEPNGIGVIIIETITNGFPNGITITNNVISGNTYGLHIGENNANSFPVVATTITNNIIGLDSTGSTPLPNLLDGVWVKFGQGTFMVGNTISGNGRHGIRLCKSQMSNIKANWIGTNIGGAQLGNGSGNNLTLPGGSGIYLGGPGVGVMSFGDVIGGAKFFSLPVQLTEQNIIQFNVGSGIETNGFVQNATIQGNTIMHNGAHGILLGKDASNNVIGSFKSAGSLRIMGDLASQQNVANAASALGTGNTIANNGGDGIKMLSADDNVIQGNVIENNPGDGIHMVDSSKNLVGALAAAEKSPAFPPFLTIPNPLGNTITENGGFGILIKQTKCGQAVDNSIVSNAIDANAQEGIELKKS